MTGVTIDLRANNRTLDEMLERGIKDTQAFAAQATKEFAEIGQSSEELIGKLTEVVDQLADLSKAQMSLNSVQAETVANLHKQTNETLQLVNAVKEESAATAQTIARSAQYTEVLEETSEATKVATAVTDSYTASIVKNAVELAAGLLTTAKFNLAMLAMEVAYEGVRAVAESTGKEISVFDSRLLHSRQIINECNGDIDKLERKLDELGVTADEIGIKLQTNWDRIGESTNKLLEQAFKGGVDKVAEDVESTFSQMWNKVAGYGDRAVTSATKQLTSFVDKARNSVKEWQLSWAKAYGEFTGVNRQTLEDVLNFERRREQAAKDSKVAEINKAMTKEQREATTAFFMERQAQANATIFLEKLVARQTIESGKAKLKALMDERTALSDYNMFFGDAARSWQMKYDAVAEAQERLIENAKRLRKETGDLVSRGAAEKDEDSQTRERENIAYAIMGRKQLLQLIEDEEDAIRALANSEKVGSDEWYRDRENAENRLADLKAAHRAAERREIEEDNAKNAQNIDFQKRLKDQALEQNFERESTLRDNAQAAELQRMELQGASLAALHKKVIDNLAQERNEALKHVREVGASEEQQREIAHQYNMRALREEAQFRTKSAEDNAAAGRALQEFAKSKRDEEFEAMRKTEREIHEYRIASLREEADAAMKLAIPENEKLQIQLDLQKAITAEKKRFTDLQKEGKDVDLKQGGKEPQTLAAQMKELREYRAQQKKNLAEAQKKKADEKAAKKSEAKAKLADRDANRAMEKQKAATALAAKVKQREDKKKAYEQIQKRDREKAILMKARRAGGLSIPNELPAATLANIPKGVDPLAAMRDAMKGDKQVSLQTQMVNNLRDMNGLLLIIKNNTKNIGALT